MSLADVGTAEKPPPPPSLDSITGSWIVVRAHGEVCKLLVEGRRAEGEMTCVGAARNYQARVSGLELHRQRLVVYLGSGGDRLEGEVVRSRFSAKLGQERRSSFARLSYWGHR